jgi:hypothetical protein
MPASLRGWARYGAGRPYKLGLSGSFSLGRRAERSMRYGPPDCRAPRWVLPADSPLVALNRRHGRRWMRSGNGSSLALCCSLSFPAVRHRRQRHPAQRKQPHQSPRATSLDRHLAKRWAALVSVSPSMARAVPMRAPRSMPRDPLPSSSVTGVRDWLRAVSSCFWMGRP